MRELEKELRQVAGGNVSSVSGFDVNWHVWQLQEKVFVEVRECRDTSFTLFQSDENFDVAEVKSVDDEVVFPVDMKLDEECDVELLETLLASNEKNTAFSLSDFKRHLRDCLALKQNNFVV
jgi:hypothetical protein